MKPVPDEPLTVAELRKFLTNLPDDMSVAFVDYFDGHAHFVEALEVRQIDRGRQVVSRDQETVEDMHACVISILG